MDKIHPFVHFGVLVEQNVHVRIGFEDEYFTIGAHIAVNTKILELQSVADFPEGRAQLRDCRPRW